MAQQLAPNNRWSNTSTVVPTRPASCTDVEKPNPPPLGQEQAQVETPRSPATPDFAADQGPSSIEKRPITLDWTGPDDPLNPHNWSSTRRWFQTYTISGVALVGTFASSVFTPAIEPTAGEFHSATLTATLAFSIYQLGLAFGGPFAAPLSETYGRKPVVFISLPIFALFVLGTGFAQSMAALVVLRFWAGVFAAPSLSMGSGTLSDLWPPERRSGPMSMYVAAPFFGPAIGPLLGAAVTQTMGWRWTAWLILFFTVALVIVPAPFYWESYKPVLLRERAKKEGQPLPPSPLEGYSWAKALHIYVSRTLTRPLHMLVTEPIVLAFNAYSAFNFGLLYAFFAAFPRVYAQFYGFDSLSTGLTFLSIGVGIVLASVTILLFSKRWYLPRVRAAIAADAPKPAFATSRLPPEERLPLAMVGGPCITVGLFLYGWTTAYRVHWLAPTVAEGLFGFGNMLVFMACMMYMTDTYGPMYSASAMASNAVLRYVLGGTFPLFAVQMFERLGPQWACTLLGCLSVLGAGVPFVLAKFGPGLRSRSEYKKRA